MSIYGKYFVMQYLLICHASLSQSITPLRLAGQKCWLFPHPLFISLGSSKRTETLCGCSYNPHRQPVPQPGAEFTHNRFAMYMRG